VLLGHVEPATLNPLPELAALPRLVGVQPNIQIAVAVEIGTLQRQAP
jgi:hypothetical protein